METQFRNHLIKNTSILLDYLAIADTLKPADIIWGLGSNDLGVAQEAALLFHRKMAPWILFSGGKGHRWQDLAQSEAETFRNKAILLGAEASRILLETQSTNTGENITFSLPVLENAGVNIASAILITIPPFQRRAAATLRKHRPDILCINTPISWGAPSEWKLEKLLHSARLCVGEIRRLQSYPEKDFIAFDQRQIPQQIVGACGALEDLITRVVR